MSFQAFQIQTYRFSDIFNGFFSRIAFRNATGQHWHLGDKYAIFILFY
jgi:hypothetical protein